MENRKIGIIFILAIALSFFAGYQIQTFLVDNEPEPFVSVYDEITEALDRYYLYELEAEEKDQAFLAQMQAIVSSYATSNDDPYTRLIASPVGIAPTSAENYVGIGITIQNEGNFLRVLDVIYEGPSYQKLYPNDLIIGVVQNDSIVYFEDLSAHITAASYLAGSINEVKTLIVENPNKDVLQVDITYEQILTPTAYHQVIDDGVGYIKITEFSGYIKDVTEGTAKVFTDSLNALEETTIVDETDTLILDLRNNPGGSLSALHNHNQSGVIPGISQMLIRKDVERPIFSMINKNDVMTHYYGGLINPKPYDIKVLVNERSASAAEVLAAALNINGGYDLYGNPTYGKDVYQNTVLLKTIDSVSYYLTYTEGHWVYNVDQKVSEFPLQVEIIEQTGFNAIDLMMYQSTLEIDHVDDSLIPYQMFLNAYFELEGNARIREDGYFDQITEDYILQYQQENGLTQSSQLDLETARHMFDTLKVYQNDLAYDVQLQTLIGMI